MRPLGGLVACFPRNFLYSTLDSDLILGGGGKLKLEGGNPSAPPPLYATLTHVHFALYAAKNFPQLKTTSGKCCIASTLVYRVEREYDIPC